MNAPRDPLDSLLNEWGNAPSVESLSADVRQQLAEPAAASSRRPAPWWATLDAAVSRPSFAVAFVAACVLLGLFLAELRVSRLHRERDVRLIQSYRQLIDPLLTATPAEPPTATGSRT